MSKHDWLSISLTVISVLFMFGAFHYYDRRSEARYLDIQAKLSKIAKEREARQTMIKRSITDTASPTVDATSRVTRRDSSDLPPTGRVSRPSNVIRRGGDHHGEHDDGGLQERT